MNFFCFEWNNYRLIQGFKEGNPVFKNIFLVLFRSFGLQNFIKSINIAG